MYLDFSVVNALVGCVDGGHRGRGRRGRGRRKGDGGARLGKLIGNLLN